MTSKNVLTTAIALIIGLIVGKFWSSNSDFHITSNGETDTLCMQSCAALYHVATDESSRVDVDTAIASILLYGKFQGMLENHFKDNENPIAQTFYDTYHRQVPHAFFIPIEDLQNMVTDTFSVNGQPAQTIGARLYRGLVWGGVHLYMIPTVRTAANETLDVIPTGIDSNQFVYDFITPCPIVCDTSNLLEKAFARGKEASCNWTLSQTVHNRCLICSDTSTTCNPKTE